MLTGFIILALIGVLVCFWGWIRLLIATFHVSTFWGLGFLLGTLLGAVFHPVAFIGSVLELAFLVSYWENAKKGFFTQLAGFGIMFTAVFFGPQGFKSQILAKSHFHIPGMGSPLPPIPTENGVSKPDSNAEAFAELSKREAALLARKTALDPNDKAGAIQLRADVLAYNADLKTVSAKAEAAAAATPTTRVAAAVMKDLVSLRQGSVSPCSVASLAPVRFYAVYFSAEWCPPCRGFTPELVAWYNQNKPSNPNFEVIFVSRDRSAAEMAHYMSADAMPWPAIAWDKTQSTLMSRYAGSGIPCLVFMDGDGNVLSDSYAFGSYRGPRAVLADMTQKLSVTKGLAQRQ